MIACDSRLAIVARNNLVSVRDDNLRVGCVLFASISPFRSAKVLLSSDEIIAKRSIVAGALFETIIALGWTRPDYWWTAHNFILHA